MSHRELDWLFLAPDTGLDHCPRILLSCFKARISDGQRRRRSISAAICTFLERARIGLARTSRWVKFAEGGCLVGDVFEICARSLSMRISGWTDAGCLPVSDGRYVRGPATISPSPPSDTPSGQETFGAFTYDVHEIVGFFPLPPIFSYCSGFLLTPPPPIVRTSYM